MAVGTWTAATDKPAMRSRESHSLRYVRNSPSRGIQVFGMPLQGDPCESGHSSGRRYHQLVPPVEDLPQAKCAGKRADEGCLESPRTVISKQRRSYAESDMDGRARLITGSNAGSVSL